MPSLAVWSSDPAVNDIVCSAPENQTNVQILADGTGGSFLVWEDGRNPDPEIDSNDIYVQRFSADGVAQWPPGGVALVADFIGPAYPRICIDGSGGIIVTWHSRVSSTRYNIFAQRLNGSGVRQWAARGKSLLYPGYPPNFGSRYNAEIVSDGAGGAIVVYVENLNNLGTTIMAQRLNGAGDLQWNTGVEICTAAGNHYWLQNATDGSGGAIVTWEDSRSGNSDIYAQRVNSSGVVQWTTSGVSLCSAAAQQFSPQATGDGSGGAIVTWFDYRNDPNTADIYAGHIDSLGVPQWTTDGVAVCTAGDYQQWPQIASDDIGGAIVAWEDSRSGDNVDIYAQRLDALGVPQWTANGVSLSGGGLYAVAPEIVRDGSGGAIIAWQDSRQGFSDIFAQRVNASGLAQWTPGGVAISAAVNDQQHPQLAYNAAGGAIVTWTDFRNSDLDIYASHVSSGGALPVCLSSFTLQ